MTVPATMAAVYLTGHGGYDKLEYRTDVSVPTPGTGDVLIRVAAAGVNNTDVNTRTAWYSKTVNTATEEGGGAGFGVNDDADGAWTGAPLEFPRIQGADACGVIVAVGDGVAAERVGERVLVRSMQPDPNGEFETSCVTWGSESDGGFAQYATARSSMALAVQSDWTDVELASIPCAFSTAEGMIDRGSVGAERVMITGASGGVGAAAIQLCKRRGAEVIAVAGEAKHGDVLALGADRVVSRGADLVDVLGQNSVEVVLDVVAGPAFGSLLEVLRPGGRYCTVGAIAGPIVDLDVRTLYLKDLSLFGSTFQYPHVFENLVRYIEADEIRPVVAATYPLSDIVQAQQDFLSKKHTGKLVLIPPN